MASKVTGQEALLRRLKAIGEPRPLLRALQLQTVREAKLLVPRQTGHLRRSIVAGSISGNSATVEARTGYAAFVEFGTKAHTIRPKNKKVLSWPASGSARLSGRTKTGGRRIIARVVNHPGTKAKPYLVPGAKKALERGGFRDTVVKNWNNAA